MKTKQVSMKIDSNVYAVLRHYATLEDRSVRNWFERYIRTTFEKEYNLALKATPNTGVKTDININPKQESNSWTGEWEEL